MFINSNLNHLHKRKLPIKHIVESMSTLGIVEGNSEHIAGQRKGTSIGARILRKRSNITYSFDDNVDGNNGNDRKSKADKKENKFKIMGKKAIEKLYTTKTMGSLKKTNLETIFEHEKESESNDELDTSDNSNIFGQRKLKRCANLQIGKPTKVIKEKRIKRARNLFGHRRFKKLSMKNFIERLKSSELVEFTEPVVVEGELMHS